MKKRLAYLAATLTLFLVIIVGATPVQVEAATSAEKKAGNHAKSWCNNIPQGADDYDNRIKNCQSYYKAFYLGDGSGAPKCTTGNSGEEKTAYEWCFEGSKEANSQRSGDFKSINNVCSSFISNSSGGGGWPNFKALSGGDKNSAITECKKGLAAGLTYTAGDYPNSAKCSGSRNILVQACYAGRSLADAHIFTPAEATNVAKSGKLAKTNNGQGGGNATGNQNSNTEDEEGPPSCDSSGGFGLSWLLCQVIEGLAEASDTIYTELVEPLLNTKPIDISSPADDKSHTYAIWSNFRTYGNIILVITLLVIVFSEAIGGGLLSAYAVKKTLPRLLIAAILINISIYIVAVAIDISNIVGVGIQSLIEAPFRNAGDFKLHISGGGGTLGFGAFFGAGAMTTIWALAFPGAFLQFLFLFVLIPAFLTMVAIMITLLTRTGLIIFLTIISPVAFALFCLPNTEKYFRQWWDVLFKALLMYPIIAVIFALANVLSVTINSISEGAITGPMLEFMSIFALLVPLFLIPYSFRLAGGLMGQVAGLIQDRKNQLQAPLNRYRSKKLQEHGQEMMHRAEGANWYRNAPEGSKRARINKALQTAALTPKALENSGGKPSKIRENMADLRSTDKIAGISKNAENSLAFQQMSKVDTLLNAATHGNMQESDWRQYLQQAGMSAPQVDQSVAQIRRAKAEMGESFEAAALIANSGTGTGLGDGPGEVARHIARISQGDTAMQGALIAQVRSTAKQAGRGDIADASFGAYLGAVKSIDGANGEAEMRATQEAAQESLVKSGFKVLNPAQAMNDRGLSLKNRIPVLRKNLEEATALSVEANTRGYAMRTKPDGSQERISVEQADRMATEALAQIGALEAAGGTMENRKILSEEILSRTMPSVAGSVGDVGTIQDNLEAFKTDPLYQQYLAQYRDYEGSPLAPQGLSPQQMAALQAQRAAQGEIPQQPEPPEGQG